MPHKHVNLPTGRARGPHLCGQALACSVVKEELDDFQVVFLGCHIQRRETVLQNKNKMSVFSRANVFFYFADIMFQGVLTYDFNIDDTLM